MTHEELLAAWVRAEQCCIAEFSGDMTSAEAALFIEARRYAWENDLRLLAEPRFQDVHELDCDLDEDCTCGGGGTR